MTKYIFMNEQTLLTIFQMKNNKILQHRQTRTKTFFKYLAHLMTGLTIAMHGKRNKFIINHILSCSGKLLAERMTITSKGSHKHMDIPSIITVFEITEYKCDFLIFEN